MRKVVRFVTTTTITAITDPTGDAIAIVVVVPVAAVCVI